MFGVEGINANDLALLQKYFHDAVAKALTENEGYQVVEEPGRVVSLHRTILFALHGGNARKGGSEHRDESSRVSSSEGCELTISETKERTS